MFLGTDGDGCEKENLVHTLRICWVMCLQSGVGNSWCWIVFFLLSMPPSKPEQNSQEATIANALLCIASVS